MDGIRELNVFSLKITDLVFDVLKHKKGNPGASKSYFNCICAFDIETTYLAEIDNSIMYHWQFSFDNKVIVTGRTWDEFIILVDMLNEISCVYDANYLIFVHNLGFEFSFLKGILDFRTDDVFAVKPRKVLRAKYNGLEFRCSSLLSNMSLAQFCDKMKVETPKLEGFDYRKIRYPWTPLSDFEKQYCIVDVISLVQCIRQQLIINNDDLYSLPYTSTGYLRREVKRIMLQKYNRAIAVVCYPTFPVYRRLKEAFRGGDCHANRYYTGVILDDVRSFDRSSSYPDVLVNCKYPCTQFFEETQSTYANFLDRMDRRKKACLVVLRFVNLRMKDCFCGDVYLSKDKCRGIIDPVVDNGRILSASQIETTITDVDFKIIRFLYAWDSVEVLELWTATYKYLPDSFRDLIIKLYREKTELKNVPGQEVFYEKSKNRINSAYGLSAQDPVKQSIIYEDYTFTVGHEDPEQLLEEFFKKHTLPYQWGVWTTAHARYRLFEGKQLVGVDNFVYSDTDSVKCLGSPDFTEYNKRRIADSKKSGAFATDSKGIVHYMGVYEEEQPYTRFITLGAKKYAYEYLGGKIGVTVSGVSKKLGGKELSENGGLKAFRPGFIFKDAGGLEARYNDKPTITDFEIDGHFIKVTSNVSLVPSTYTLGLSGEYEKLLKNTEIFLDFISDRCYNKYISERRFSDVCRH